MRTSVLVVFCALLLAAVAHADFCVDISAGADPSGPASLVLQYKNDPQSPFTVSKDALAQCPPAFMNATTYLEAKCSCSCSTSTLDITSIQHDSKVASVKFVFAANGTALPMPMRLSAEPVAFKMVVTMANPNSKDSTVVSWINNNYQDPVNQLAEKKRVYIPMCPNGPESSAFSTSFSVLVAAFVAVCALFTRQ